VPPSPVGFLTPKGIHITRYLDRRMEWRGGCGLDIYVMSENLTAVVAIGIVAATIIALLVFLVFRDRSRRLKEQFGPEYSRAIAETGDRWKAEKVLEHRKQRVEKLNIRRLDTSEVERYRDTWKSIQAEFIDDPNGTLIEAHRLIESVLLAEGYPVADFEQRAADISVDHPGVVENYRGGRQVVLKHAKGHASTEDLRKAMLHYQALFNDLLDHSEFTQTGRAVR
jgi:hypothetical protein